jgi:hypothetical protein
MRKWARQRPAPTLLIDADPAEGLTRGAVEQCLRWADDHQDIYGHIFAQDRTTILDAMNQAVSRLYATKTTGWRQRGSADAVA